MSDSRTPLRSRQVKGGYMPLSAAQRRLWILQQLDSEDPSSNRPLAIRMSGQVELPALERSLSGILRRHEILRSVFPEIDGHPAQVVNPAGRLNLEITDLQSLPVHEREPEARRIAKQEVLKTIDLATR